MLTPEFLTHPMAHRGLHDVMDGRPENSIEAFRAAIDHGYGIELDVQLTADNDALVFHDYDLQRLTSVIGRVRNRTCSDLSTIPLLGGPSGPPSLSDVLAMVQGRVPLLIELKDQDGALGDDVYALEVATARALDGYVGPVAVMSFNPHSVSALQTLAPDIPRGLVTETFDAKHWKIKENYAERLSAIVDYERVGACFISHNHKHLSSPRVAALQNAGASVLCWTVTTPEQEAEARQIADNVTFERYLPAVPS